MAEGFWDLVSDNMDGVWEASDDLFEIAADTVGAVWDAAVESKVLNDMIAGATIGAGISYLTDNNVWMGAGLGAVGGFASNNTSYDLTDFMFKPGADTTKSSLNEDTGKFEKETVAGKSIMGEIFSGDNIAKGGVSMATTLLGNSSAEKKVEDEIKATNLARQSSKASVLPAGFQMNVPSSSKQRAEQMNALRAAKQTQGTK